MKGFGLTPFFKGKLGGALAKSLSPIGAKTPTLPSNKVPLNTNVVISEENGF